MLSPKQMTHALIVGHKSVMKQTVDSLHELNLFHIDDYNEEETGFNIGKPFEKASEVSRKLVKLRSISSLLDLEKKGSSSPGEIPEEFDKKLEELDAAVSEKTEHKKDIEAKIRELESLRKELIPLAGIPLDLDLYRDYENISVYVGTIGVNIEPEVEKITHKYELFIDSRTSTIALFVPKEYEEEISKLLSSRSFKELKVPEIKGLPSKIITQIDGDIEKLRTKIETTDEEIFSLKEKYSDFILASENKLSIENEKLEAPLRIATSEHTFVIDGWVPSQDYYLLEQSLEESTGGHVHVSKLDEKDFGSGAPKEPPTEYDNHRLVKPFEVVVDLFSRPKYKELDPTLVIFFTFPLFYGMILGDMGYSLLLLAIAYTIYKYVNVQSVKSVMMVLIYCQIFSLMFGLLYMEIFGFPLAGYYTADGAFKTGLIPGFVTVDLFTSPISNEMITYPLHRQYVVDTILVLSVIIGLLHINLGYLLGFMRVNRNHGFMEAVFEKGSWFVLQISFLLLALGYLGYIAMTYGIIVLVISLAMLFKGEGIQGPVEIPSFFSNTLSYTRVAAVGLSHIYIASTINMISFEMVMPDTFGLLTIFAIIILILGHALNTVLSIVAPGLHAIRLQYVEFFTKFYEGGGRKYKPFGYMLK
ncbi:V-type ATPase 116 kDa subunit [Methanosalsum zhilinae DSM 4017]|uniref:A-type ATP synthase subunit I n=1 Tax=Methanosalsum zhilinae (strain DSM 4017 / NBRC 107636 / OCM 62 / WeN5) TaxID=679901 RepID=F7XP31_METZD|nr:V-type ATP synthase subunit I [Methanosalsum zhilinae]AEH61323.1 V-type ATPase 116 kDa subunit [Methanosalsum zhilinae DSM 4017]